MGLTFEQVDKILKSYGLVPHKIKHGQCMEYSFEDRVLYVKQKNVATRVTSLINGGIGGYIYFGHLKEYDNYTGKTKMGHIPIGEMTEEELRSTIQMVIKEYR